MPAGKCRTDRCATGFAQKSNGRDSLSVEEVSMANDDWMERFHRAFYFGRQFGPTVSYEGALYLIPDRYVPPPRWQRRGMFPPIAVWETLT